MQIYKYQWIFADLGKINLLVVYLQNSLILNILINMSLFGNTGNNAGGGALFGGQKPPGNTAPAGGAFGGASMAKGGGMFGAGAGGGTQ